MDARTLRSICPACKDPQGVAAALAIAFERFRLDSPERQACFIAQTAHESGQFNRLVENLNYSAQGLATTWPGRYAIQPNARVKVPNGLASRLARKPEAIANHTYANRMGNGGPETGDGWRYRGRGWIMLTGLDNYSALHSATGLDCLEDPDLVATPAGAAVSAGWYWTRNECNRFADCGDIVALTRAINGGLVGLVERRHFTEAARRAFA